MKAFIALAMLLTLNNSNASDLVNGKVKVLSADFDKASDSINITAEVSGLCDAEMSVRMRGCTDTFFPYTCFLDVNATGAGCEGTTNVQISYSREELNMNTRQFSDATLVVQNNKGKSRQYLKLPINR